MCEDCTQIVLKKIPPVWLVRLIAVLIALGGCALSFLPFALGRDTTGARFLMGLTIAGVGMIGLTFSYAMTGFKD